MGHRALIGTVHAHCDKSRLTVFAAAAGGRARKSVGLAHSPPVSWRVIPGRQGRKPTDEAEAGACIGSDSVAARAAASRHVGQTPLTVGALIEVLQIDHCSHALFRQFPGLDAEDVRDAVDYAARQGLLTRHGQGGSPEGER